MWDQLQEEKFLSYSKFTRTWICVKSNLVKGTTTKLRILDPPTCTINQHFSDPGYIKEEEGFSRTSTPDSLVVASWNCCGLWNPIIIQRLLEIHMLNSHDIVFLMETKNLMQWF